MKVIYTRVSSRKQNNARQLVDSYDKEFNDVLSGSVPFNDRIQAKKLMKFLESNPDTLTVVCSVDRLGRDLKDILNTIDSFEKNGWKLEIKQLPVDVFSATGRMVVSLLGTISELELKTIRDRQKQGVAVAKAEGKYLGRQKGATETKANYLKKHKDIVNCLESGMKLFKIHKTTEKSRVTINRVKKLTNL